MTGLSNKVVLSFLRHLAAAALAVIFAIAGLNHVSIFDVVKVLQAAQHFTAHQWAMVANAIWVAALMQARFGVEPWVKVYLKKRFPGAMASGLIDEIFGYADKELNVLTPIPVAATPVSSGPPPAPAAVSVATPPAPAAAPPAPPSV